MAEWHATRTGAANAEREGRETRHMHPDAGRVAAERIAAFNDRITGLDPSDATGRAQAARDLAGALAALARDRQDPDLQRAAREVACHAAYRRMPEQAGTRPRPVLGPAVLVLMQTSSGQRTAATRLITDQLLRAVIALHAQQRATGRPAEADRLHARALLPVHRTAQAARLESAPSRSHGPGPGTESVPGITRARRGRDDRGR
ncbi:MAG TPA: hypothetical protein VGJ14_08735 [Sporichthyaceae bacterium]